MPVLGDSRALVSIIDPGPDNGLAIRAYEKVGFRYFGSADTAEGPDCFMKPQRGESLG